jgi:hypothetical protein
MTCNEEAVPLAFFVFNVTGLEEVAHVTAGLREENRQSNYILLFLYLVTCNKYSLHNFLPI